MPVLSFKVWSDNEEAIIAFTKMVGSNVIRINEMFADDYTPTEQEVFEHFAPVLEIGCD